MLRWEYRLGSTLYAVYTRSQAGFPIEVGGTAPATLRPVGLLRGPATDSFLLKWSYYWDA